MQRVTLLCGLAALLVWSLAVGRAVSQDDSNATEVTDSSSDDSTDMSADTGDDEEELGPTLPWQGESPHWSYGQEFSAVKDAPFVGSAECLLCHKTFKTDFLHTAHARTLADSKMARDQQGCEMCHGAGGAHAALKSRGAIFAFDWKDPRHTNDICLRCHSWKTSNVEWDATTHAKAGMKCSDCHDPHVPATSPYRFLLTGNADGMCLKCHADVKRDFTRFSHHPVSVDPGNTPGADAMHCTDCHDVHTGHGRAMLAERNTQDLCLKCHIDKAGPFRYVHASTQDGVGEGCLTCHNNHGSDNAWLHKADGRSLCIQCHTDREEHYKPQTCWTSGCHSQMHGSNTNLLFLR